MAQALSVPRRLSADAWAATSTRAGLRAGSAGWRACATNSRRLRRFAAGKLIGIALFLFAALAPAQTGSISDVLQSSHNLSAGGPGPVRSSDTRPCVICHISHNGYTETMYLWNHQTSTAPATPYQSPTLNATAGNPATGSSKLCLSCHDGTVALGQTKASGLVSMSGSLAANDITGVNFNRHHPVGIRPVDDGQLYAGLAQTPARSADPAVKLPGNLIECITCHDPHVENRDAARGKFLVRSNDSSAICLACHDPSRGSPNRLMGWPGSAHQAAANARNELYGTVGRNGCQSCHLPHNPVAAVPLLRDTEERVCAQCHAGSGTTPALPSVASELALTYSHPVTSTASLHVSNENAFPLNANRHAACSDCHSSHAAQSAVSPSLAPALPPSLAGASGVDGLSGQTALWPASHEYEICFKCHANSSGKPQMAAGYARYGRTPWRVLDATAPDPFNTRLEFNSGVARHNVVNPRWRAASDVPSLRAAMLTLTGAAGRGLGTHIYCGDCHSNNEASRSGGANPSGPHGSLYPHILERRYEGEPPPATPGSSAPGVGYQPGLAGTYALCDKCHDIANSILQDRSFRRHNLHIQGEHASCSTCHDSHGISGGNLTNNYALINFDTSIVGPSSSGVLRYERTGAFQGRCYLRCHGQNHSPESY